MVRILIGDVRAMLATLPDESVHCCVTSPPYFGLRDYGVDGQIGLENSPREFIDVMVGVFREVRRVLRDDGTCWVNMGDSYAANRGAQVESNRSHSPASNKAQACSGRGMIAADIGFKPKDKMLMPHRLAIALCDDGWYVRDDIVWAKPNPMPESVTDRCTKAHEYIFLLAKSQRYYFDADAIKEECSDGTHPRRSTKMPDGWATHAGGHGSIHKDGREKGKTRHLPGNKTHKGATACEEGDEKHRTKASLVDYATRQRKLAEPGSGTKNNSSFDAAMAVMPETRNKRSVWTITTKPFSEAHFATFPPELPEICIKAGSKPGDVVLDPFFGAGTTGLVADRLGRDCIGIELNPAYAEMARKRIHGDAPLFSDCEAA